MRGLTRLAAAPAAASMQTLLSSSRAFSSFSGAGGGGRGRGRGRGSAPPFSPPSRVPGEAHQSSADDDDAFPPPGIGHGRGVVLPSSPDLPSFSSWNSSLPSGLGRGGGRGTLHPPPPPPMDASDSISRKPIFFRRDESVAASETPQAYDPEEAKPLPMSVSPIVSGSGRGKPMTPVDSGPKPSEENRHLRPRAAPRRVEPSSQPSQPKLSREEAMKKAMELLSRGGTSGRGGRSVRGRGRGRGERYGRGGRFAEAGDGFNLYLGDNADGEKLEKRLGEANMNKLVQGFEELSYRVLPSPMEEAYLDALHTNNLIEYEPEYLVQFDTNPDIDEKPPMPLREFLEKCKPFLIAYEGIRSHEEWEEIINEIMEKLPVMEELMEMYCGPDTVTAKQQNEELERVAKTLPENAPSSVKRFTDRALLSLQSNPGWGFDKKCQFMDKLVWEVSQQYK